MVPVIGRIGDLSRRHTLHDTAVLADDELTGRIGFFRVLQGFEIVSVL